MADSSNPIAALRVNTQEIQDTKKQLVDINAAMQSELSTAASATEQGTTISSKGVRTTPLAIKQEMMADLQAQKANQDRASAINYEQLSVGLLDQIVTEGKKADAKIAEVEAINNGGFIDQVAGLFTIPFKQAEIETAQARQANASSTLAQVNQHMQASSKTTAEIQTRLTEGTIESMSSAIEADTRAEAARIRADGLYKQSTHVLQVANLSGEQLRNKVKEYDILVNEEQRAFMNEQRALNRRQFDKELKEEKLTGQLYDLVNLGLQANGKQPLPESQRELMKSQLNRTGPMGDSLRELAFQGQTILTAGGKVVQGSTPTEAAQFRQKINYEPATNEERNTLEIVQAQFGSQAVLEAKGAAKVEAANKAVLDKLNADQSNISGAPDSLAKPATWATLATSEGIRNHRVWKEVISPTITDNISTNYAEPKEMYTRLVGAVTSGKANINEAADLYTKYAVYSVEMNNVASGLEKLTGFKQSKFIARLPQPASGVIPFLAAGADDTINAFLNPLTLQTARGLSNVSQLVPSGSAPVNGLDKTAVTNAMSKTVAEQLRRKPN